MRIGALARLTRTQPQTIRYYERQGLLTSPQRTGGNYREYGEHHRKQLGFVLHCRTLGLSLAEIRLLIGHQQTPASDCDGVAALVTRHIDETSRKIVELQQLQGDLRALRDRCSQGRTAASCGILRGIGEVSSGHGGGKHP